MVAGEVVQKIDVHRNSQAYQRSLRNLNDNVSVSGVNKAKILEFLRDCELGKTVLKRQKKRIREKRLLKYTYLLPRFSAWIGNKPFDRVASTEMETFIADLEGDRLVCPRTGKPVRYSEWTKHDIKVCVKKFYKWLMGGNERYPDLVAWIDTSISDSAPPSLTREEIARCVDFASTVKGKALVWTLFQTGARVEEFLNIRIEHVRERGGWFAVRIEFPKTYRRTLPVHDGADFLRQWLEAHPGREDPQAQLFPMSYEAVRKYLRRLGERAVGKRLTPQLVRDSFATWLATKKVGRYQMCKLMGWAMSSNMPDRYIDRVGVVEEDAIQSIRGDDLSGVSRENEELKGTLQRLEARYSEMQEKLAKQAEMDDLLMALFQDKAVEGPVLAALRKNGLGEKLLRL